MSEIKKAYAISDAKIGFVSLVDKAANKTQFLIKKAENGSADFLSNGSILKCDAENHYITGIVYELMTVEISDNEDVWQAVEKGELTGFSMGGVGKYSEVDDFHIEILCFRKFKNR